MLFSKGVFCVFVFGFCTGCFGGYLPEQLTDFYENEKGAN
jgi:hypothetical protein